MYKSRPRKAKNPSRARRRKVDDFNDAWQILSQDDAGPETDADDDFPDRASEIVFGRRLIRSLEDE